MLRKAKQFFSRIIDKVFGTGPADPTITALEEDVLGMFYKDNRAWTSATLSQEIPNVTEPSVSHALRSLLNRKMLRKVAWSSGGAHFAYIATDKGVLFYHRNCC